MESSSECESADVTDAEQLTTAHCTSEQQNGEGSAPAMATAYRTPAENHQRAEENTEERAAWLQSYAPLCARCSPKAY